MKVNFKIFPVISLVLIFLLINSEKSYAQSTPQSKVFYLGTNPVALPLGLPLKDELKRFLPIASGNEYGSTIVGGYFLKPNQSIETRISLSNIHQIAFVGQIHLGYNRFLKNNTDLENGKGWYFSAYLKYWDFYNRHTKIHFHNICPYISLGHNWELNRFIFDFRLNQTLAVASWSSLENTRGNTAWMLSPWPEFIRVLPTMSFTFAYKFYK